MDRQVSAIINGVSDKANKTACRYLGRNATLYESKRQRSAKWLGEDLKVKKFLTRDLRGSSILDIPCGTGRFFPFYQSRHFKFIGMDISPDMVGQASQKTTYTDQARIGNIFDIDICTVFDVVVCVRFLNLIKANDLKQAFSEMQRVGRRIIFTLRTKHNKPTGHYHSPHPISLIEKSLSKGWKITRNERVHERDYRMIEVVDEMG